jgi:transposase-like protein/DNA-binding transcriptional ArsR family regulator
MGLKYWKIKEKTLLNETHVKILDYLKESNDYTPVDIANKLDICWEQVVLNLHFLQKLLYLDKGKIIKRGVIPTVIKNYNFEDTEKGRQDALREKINQILAQFPDDLDELYKMLYKIKYKDQSINCPFCANRNLTLRKNRGIIPNYTCNNCRNDFNILTNSYFHNFKFHSLKQYLVLIELLKDGYASIPKFVIILKERLKPQYNATSFNSQRMNTWIKTLNSLINDCENKNIDLYYLLTNSILRDDKSYIKTTNRYIVVSKDKISLKSSKRDKCILGIYDDLPNVLYVRTIDLADKYDIPHARLTNYLKILENKGLIESTYYMEGIYKYREIKKLRRSN